MIFAFMMGFSVANLFAAVFVWARGHVCPICNAPCVCKGDWP